MKRFWKWILKVLTLNGRFFIKQKVVEHAAAIKTELSVSSTTNVLITPLIKALGTKTNIVAVNSTVSTLSVEVKDVQKIDQKELKNLGAKGMFVSEQKLKMVFGDDSGVIAKELQIHLNLKA